MNFIRLSVERPVAVAAVVILTVMLGLIALVRIPIQLIPEVNKPIISVVTNWFGASPAEVEREIINRQEEVFKGLEGLEKMTASAEDGRARVTLEFRVGQEMSRMLLLVANRLDQVQEYPAEVDRPILRTSSTDDNPITWIVMRRLPGNVQPVHTYGDMLDDMVKDRLERVPGVSQVNLFGESEREIRITMDPERMARYGLTATEVLGTLRGANVAVSAGDVEEGKRRYVVRTEGELTTLKAVREVQLRSYSDAKTGRTARIRVGDIADVDFGYKKPIATIRMLGQPALAVNAIRETGSNVIEVMSGIRAVIDDLNKNVLPSFGVYLTQVYDETVYIESSIDLVQQNIFVGGALAALILLIFLKSPRATLIIAIAMPVSIIGSFIAMTAFGRTINVISLAGLAFAIGMVVDAAIVVLENIDRLRSQGLSRVQAAFKGAAQVWSAILASALTTVVAFAPLLVLQLEVGQLFRDIAVALSVAVILSLIVAVTVIPALSNRLMAGDRTAPADGGVRDAADKANPAAAERPAAGERARRLFDAVFAPFDKFGSAFIDASVTLARRVTKSPALAIGLVVGICGSTAFITWAFLPKLDYLPNGNRNLVVGVIVPPPGYNLETTTKIANDIESRIKHLWPKEVQTEGRAKPGADRAPTKAENDKEPHMQRFFFVARRADTFVGAAAEDPARVGELIPILKKAAFQEPGTFGIVSQRSLFGRSLGGERTIELDISGPDLDDILATAIKAAGYIEEVLPRAKGNQMRPQPGLELGAPEIRILPDRVRLSDNGVTARELGDSVDVFNDGLRVVEITVEGRRMDLTLAGPEDHVRETQGIANLPVVTQSGKIVPVSSLADIVLTAGPTEIRHLERTRTVTLEVRPNENVPLEVSIDTIKANVMDRLQADGLPRGVKLGLSGTADKLSQTWKAMLWNVLLAMVVVYLMMAILYESFVYPFIIMFSVPLATAGGVIGLVLLNRFTYQALDMLTMLGFVILIGTVVNNAILLVHQTLEAVRDEGMAMDDAIVESVRNRIRPIFMSTLTSVFGMFPLVVSPGAGSELYRGLGAVVVGGLSLSAVLTLAIIPPLLSLVSGFVTVKPTEQIDKKIERRAAE